MAVIFEFCHAFILLVLMVIGLLVIASEYCEHRKIRKLEATMKRVLSERNK